MCRHKCPKYPPEITRGNVLDESRATCILYSVVSTQVIGEEGKVRVDACVNAANVLAAWADVEEATGDLAAATQLLVSSVEGYQRSLEQEEDAAVRLLAVLSISACPPPQERKCAGAATPKYLMLDQEWHDIRA